MSENKGCIIGILIIVVPFALWYYFVHIPEMDLEEVKNVERKITQEKINKISDKAKNIATEKGKKDAAIERYDTTIDSSIYYDEILGSCRMLVTIEKLHYFESDEPRARLRVKQIEYLD